MVFCINGFFKNSDFDWVSYANPLFVCPRQGEFCELKKKYEEACKKLEEDITETVELMQARETAYNDYIEQSGKKYSHVPPTKQQAGASGGGGGLLGGIGKLFG